MVGVGTVAVANEQHSKVKRLSNVKDKVKLHSISKLSNVRGLRFSKDGERLITLHKNRSIQFWQPSELELEMPPRPTVDHVRNAWPRNDGPQLAFFDDFVRPIPHSRSRGFTEVPQEPIGMLRGTIESSAGIRDIRVTGNDGVDIQAIVEGDTFKVEVPIHSLEDGVTVTAVANDGRSVSKPYQPYKRQGKDYALLIGIAQYPELGILDQLPNAAKDVEALEAVLRKKYGFETEPHFNLTSRDLKIKISNFVTKEYPADAQLLIFYAGPRGNAS